jgi:hypothetical protein
MGSTPASSPGAHVAIAKIEMPRFSSLVEKAHVNNLYSKTTHKCLPACAMLTHA